MASQQNNVIEKHFCSRLKEVGSRPGLLTARCLDCGKRFVFEPESGAAAEHIKDQLHQTRCVRPVCKRCGRNIGEGPKKVAPVVDTAMEVG